MVISVFLGIGFGFWESLIPTTTGGGNLKKKNFKGRCEKRKLPKCEGVCKSYNAIQYAYADMLNSSNEIKSFQVNVELEEEDFTSDFVGTKLNGDLMVRECISRQYLTKPMNAKLLDLSRSYWLRHGVTDWGIVIEKGEDVNE